MFSKMRSMRPGLLPGYFQVLVQRLNCSEETSLIILGSALMI